MHHILHDRCPSYLADLVVFNTVDSQWCQLRSSQTRAAVVKLKPGSIQTHATHATQALELRAMRALRKRKTQATQALALLTMIGCFDRAFLLTGACVCCVKNRIRSIVAFSYRLCQLRDLRLRTFVFCLRNFLAFIAFLAHFLFCLRIFFLRKTLRALRAFELKPGMTRTQFGKRAFWACGRVASSSSSSLFAWKK